MPRFTGNSLKITPIHMFCGDKSIEKPEKILEFVQRRTYNLDSIPSAGWIPFQNVRNRGTINQEIAFKILKLSNQQKIFPATSLTDQVDTTLRSRLSPSDYDKLPLINKYYQRPIDFVFFNKDKKLFCLVSASKPETVDITKRDFLENHPFSDLGFSVEKNPNDFIIPTDLILWLLYRTIIKNGEISETISISDISLLDGQLVVPIKLKYEGESTTQYLTELKHSIALKRTFNDVELTIKRNSDIFKFKLFSSGSVEFVPSESEFLENEKDEYQKNFEKMIEIYNTLIPTLKTTYHADKTWDPKDRDDFRRKCATDCELIFKDILNK